MCVCVSRARSRLSLDLDLSLSLSTLSRRRRATVERLSACGRCSFGGLVVRVCVPVSGVFSLSVCSVCVWPVDCSTCMVLVSVSG